MKKYKAILCDPPWEYRQSGSKTNSRGMAKQHYRTMTTEDICRLPVQKISADDSILFLWATFPNIDQALKVIEAWGFIYKTAAFVWVKKNKNGSNFWGMGAYTRANAEVCLMAIRKNTKAKKAVISHSVHQIVESIKGSHSEKPGVVRDRIVSLMGGVKRIELFARQKTKGWDVWGDEVKSDIVLK